MPVYEFSCSVCGKTFERNIPFEAEHTDIHCPSGHKKVHRVYSSVPIVFKGSGFYVTDHHQSSSGDASRS